ncbi:MAG: SIS domain-containing protein [Acidobacteria bacterium]|nr:SIS domain-containing protein [Acidobacteriota bacterium]
MLDIRHYVDTYAGVVRSLDSGSIEALAGVIAEAWRQRRTVYFCGNGGSAANAAHIAADLTKLTAPASGPRLRAVALGESLPGLTAAANDLAYEHIYAEQLRGFLEPGDVVVGLSTSGSSPNVLRALELAAEVGAVTAGVTSTSGEALQARARHVVLVPSDSVQHIEDATMVTGHLLCLLVRDLIARQIQASTAHPVRPAVTPA